MQEKRKDSISQFKLGFDETAGQAQARQEHDWRWRGRPVVPLQQGVRVQHGGPPAPVEQVTSLVAAAGEPMGQRDALVQRQRKRQRRGRELLEAEAGRRHGTAAGAEIPGETALVKPSSGELQRPIPADWELEDAAEGLLEEYRGQRSGWRGHLFSFLGVNLGLMALNALTGLAAGSVYPWSLYVTALWGIGLIIHWLIYRDWMRDRARGLQQAEVILGVARHEVLLALPHRLLVDGDPHGDGHSADPLPIDVADTVETPPASRPDTTWGPLVRDCQAAAEAAERALTEVAPPGTAATGAASKLREGLQTVLLIRRGAVAIQHAITDVAPEGVEALQQQVDQLQARIAAADERLAGVYSANLRLLQARHDKLRALLAEQERMRATVEGFLLAAQNLRLDAARLEAGQVPEVVSSLSESLDRLNREVEVVRQVEAELQRL